MVSKTKLTFITDHSPDFNLIELFCRDGLFYVSNKSETALDVHEVSFVLSQGLVNILFLHGDVPLLRQLVYATSNETRPLFILTSNDWFFTTAIINHFEKKMDFTHLNKHFHVIGRRFWGERRFLLYQHNVMAINSKAGPRCEICGSSQRSKKGILRTEISNVFNQTISIYCKGCRVPFCLLKEARK